MLRNSLKDTSRLWRGIRRLNYGKRQQSSITKSGWYNHFNGLFYAISHCNVDIVFNPVLYVSLTKEPSILDVDETIDDITLTLNRPNNGKSAGPDHVTGEMLKHVKHTLMPYLYKLFNAIFDQCTYPSSWTMSIIIPLHRRGCTSDVNNYRGISFISILSKVFTSILSSRLQLWAESNEIIPEKQRGFRKGYSSANNIFTLHTMIQQFLRRKKKLFGAFIDFGKHSTLLTDKHCGIYF